MEKYKETKNQKEGGKLETKGGCTMHATSRTGSAHDRSVTNNVVWQQGHPQDITETTIDTRIWTSSLFVLTDQRKREWCELVTITLIKLVLELHPMEPQGVKECTQGFHNKQHTNSGADEDDNTNSKDKNVVVPTKMHKA